MSIFGFLLKNKVILIIFFVLNLIFQFIPAISYIGYEFSVLNSIFIYWVVGNIFYKNNSISEKEILYSLIVLLIPLLVSIVDLNTLDIEIYLDGIKYYSLIVLPTYFFAIAVSLSISVFNTKLQKYILHISIFVILFLVNVVEIYFNPQVFIYNILIGYFPGTVYDELILINSKLIIYRVFVAIFSICLIIGLLKIKDKKNLKMVFFLLILTIYIITKPILGLSSTINETQKRLNHFINTTHFNIHFSPIITKKEQVRIAYLHEYYYERISNLLKRKLTKKVDSFIYSDKEQKGNLFGSMAADVSKPWLYQIYLDYGSIDNNLQHELVHTFTGEFGVTPFKVAKDFNAALIEGFASAIDDSLSENSIHHYASLALTYNKSFDINLLFNNSSFFSNYSNFSYTVAGSFIKYLINNYKIENVIKFYQNNDFNQSFNKSITNVTEDYKTFLTNLGYSYNVYKAKYYFAFKPLIKKQYPRYAAKINYEATILFEKKLYSEATKMYLENYYFTNSPNSLINAVNSLFYENKYSIADSLLNLEMNNNCESGYYYLLLFKQIETKILLNDTINAKKLINILKMYDISNKINIDLFKFELLIDENIELCKNYILNNYLDSVIVDRIKNKNSKLYFVGCDLNKYQNQLLEDDNEVNNIMLFYYSNNALKSGEYTLAKNLLNKFKSLNTNNIYNCLIDNQSNKIDWFEKKANRKGKN